MLVRPSFAFCERGGFSVEGRGAFARDTDCSLRSAVASLPEGKASDVVAPRAEGVAVEAVVEGNEEADEVGEKERECNADLDEAHSDGPSANVHRGKEDEGGQESHDEASKVREVVDTGQEAHGEGNDDAHTDHEQLGARRFDVRPVFDEIDEKHCFEAKDGTRCSDGHLVREEHGREDHTAGAAEDVDGDDAEGAVHFFEIPKHFRLREQVQHDVHESSVQEHGGEEAPPFASLENGRYPLASHLDEDDAVWTEHGVEFGCCESVSLDELPDHHDDVDQGDDDGEVRDGDLVDLGPFDELSSDVLGGTLQCHGYGTASIVSGEVHGT